MPSASGLREALRWFLRETDFADLKTHGNVGWTAAQLIVLAVLWVWAEQTTLTRAFGDARNLATSLFGSVAVTSYQGLLGALRSYRAQLLPLLWAHFHRLMEQSGGEHWRTGKWLPLAVDGSRVTTPRTVSNEQAFAAQNFGKGGRGRSRSNWKNKRRRSKKLSVPVKPQIWLTLVWHLGLKMPWCWTTGRSTASERDHLRELLESRDFPAFTLFCADAGFVGYEFWSAIVNHSHSFLIRVGANVHLIRKLGPARHRNGLVHCWPTAVRSRKQPPLTLRLIELQGPRGRIYLVTNVLSERELSLPQIRQLYSARWGIELQFRSLKQTFGRSKLKSRTAAHAVVELDWSLVGLWLVQLFAVKEQIKVSSPPAQSSVAIALAVVREAMRNWNGPGQEPQAFARRIRQACHDNYKRNRPKRARYRPDYKDRPTASQPVLKLATDAQRRAYQALANSA
jgi:hypothetical protein